jgi:parvulin-like peptidyl-prolyl isomerase
MALVTAVSFAACDDENAGGTGRAGGASEGGDVVAVAEGQDITRKQVDDLCAFVAMSYQMSLDDLDEANRTALFNSMLISEADNILIKNYIDESDESAAEDAKTAVDEQIESYKEQSADLDEQLSAAGITDDTVKAYIEAQYYRELLYEKALTDESVTEKEAKAYYDGHPDEFTVTPESIGLSHILISDEELTEQGRTSIEAIRQKVLDGEDFAELAKQYSTDPGSAENGGDLGAVTKGQMVAPFEEAGFKLKKGEISDVVESQYGFHVIKANTDLVPAEIATFEDAKQQIVFILLIEKLEEEHPVKYNVEVDPETGKPSTEPQETTDVGVTVEDSDAAAE